MNPLMEILASGVFAPKPVKPRQWCSVSGLKFHLEKPVSQARGRNWFEALCGVTGDFMHERFDGQTFLQCADCVQISSANILDVADQGKALQQGIESLRVGNEGGESPAMISPLESLPSDTAHGIAGVQSTATDCTPETFPWYFSCVRRGLDGFIADVDRVIDRNMEETEVSIFPERMPGSSRYEGAR